MQNVTLFMQHVEVLWKTGHRKSQTRTQAHQKKTHGMPEGLIEIVYELKGVFLSLFWVNNFFKMISEHATANSAHMVLL